MSRFSPLHLITPLVLLAACSDRPTGPLASTNLLPSTAASSAAKSDQELATITWERRAADLVKARAVSPIASARVYALVGLAQYAAVDDVDGRGNGDEKIALHEKTSVRRGAVGGASVQVMSYLFKLDIAGLEAQLAAEGAVGSADERAAFAQGVAAGRAMGDVVVARGKADGFANADGTAKVWDSSTLPSGATIWFMDADATPHVPAGFQFPFMRPYYLASADQFRPGPPPMSTAEAVSEVIAIVNARTPAQTAQAIALNLSNAPVGTITPLGDWDQIAMAAIASHNMDERAAAHVFALVNTATMDAVTGCWDAKFHYLVLRPWQVAPADLPNSKLVIGRPNHPSYPSGHSCVSAAAATVLERFFPENSDALEQHVFDNGMSRIYAGIHYRMDVESGQALGRAVADWAIKYDKENGLLAALLNGYRGNDDR